MGVLLSLNPAVDCGSGFDFSRSYMAPTRRNRYGFHVSTILAALLAMSLIAVSIFLCYAFRGASARMLREDGDDSDHKRLSSFYLFVSACRSCGMDPLSARFSVASSINKLMLVDRVCDVT